MKKIFFKMFKKEKCLKRGAMMGGKHGHEYLYQFINFFKKGLFSG